MTGALNTYATNCVTERTDTEPLVDRIAYVQGLSGSSACLISHCLTAACACLCAGLLAAGGSGDDGSSSESDGGRADILGLGYASDSEDDGEEKAARGGGGAGWQGEKEEGIADGDVCGQGGVCGCVPERGCMRMFFSSHFSVQRMQACVSRVHAGTSMVAGLRGQPHTHMLMSASIHRAPPGHTVACHI